MNIQKLSDQQLHNNLLSLKSKESHIVASIVSHLEEVYRRRLFADYRCSSIYDYCIRILGYSNGEAHRKVSACKLASNVSGVKESIAKGELSLSNATTVHTFLNQSQKEIRSKWKTSSSVVNQESDKIHLDAESIIERVKNKTSRECEIELEKIAKENNLNPPNRQNSKRKYGDKTLLKISLDSESLELLKSRLGISCEQELIQKLLTEKIKETEPKIEVKPKKRVQLSTRARTISPSKRALVFKQANKQCENCSSKHHLQIDHKKSVAIGGGNSIENLRVLCRSCNQRAAIEQLGLEKMDFFINPMNMKNSKSELKRNLERGHVALEKYT